MVKRRNYKWIKLEIFIKTKLKLIETQSSRLKTALSSGSRIELNLDIWHLPAAATIIHPTITFECKKKKNRIYILGYKLITPTVILWMNFSTTFLRTIPDSNFWWWWVNFLKNSVKLHNFLLNRHASHNGFTLFYKHH